jgi:hypothetical protein
VNLAALATGGGSRLPLPVAPPPHEILKHTVISNSVNLRNLPSPTFSPTARRAIRWTSATCGCGVATGIARSATWSRPSATAIGGTVSWCPCCRRDHVAGQTVTLCGLLSHASRGR